MKLFIFIEGPKQQKVFDSKQSSCTYVHNGTNKGRCYFLRIIFLSFSTKTKVAKLFVEDIYNGCFFDCVSYYSLNFVKQKFRLCHFVTACGIV